MNAHGLAATAIFSADDMLRIRRDTIAVAGRMDPQVFDQSGIAPFALRVSRETVEHLAREAESAWRELAELEVALLAQPARWSSLGIPSRLARLLRTSASMSQRSVRYARFDFHPTTTGWAVSEINADVPGGLLEAGPLAHIVARHIACNSGVAAGRDPARILAAAIDASCDEHDGVIALLHATSYTDDAQVMQCLQRELEARGRRATLASPAHLCVVDDVPRLTTTNERVTGLMRFFPAEWLANMPRKGSWSQALTHAAITCCNPLSAALLQSKRLPIIARAMGHELPVWSRLTPRSRPLGARVLHRQLIAQHEVLKPAWGRVGSGVCVQGVTSAKDSRWAHTHARLRPSQWIVQDRFTSVPVIAGDTSQHICLGVYVINGAFAGIYARAAARPLIDSRAQDVAVLVEDPQPVHAVSTRERAVHE
ncbi:MAG TPA: glutathionylspermidine synthase family protein [Phycisphaerales bacterium]|nr:glutathionylspermidine synthase family protein [Phycisphaerales bacterium]